MFGDKKVEFNGPGLVVKHNERPRLRSELNTDVIHKTLLDRIENYLSSGGLFNPEMMEHNKVRDLIVDCGDYIKENV